MLKKNDIAKNGAVILCKKNNKDYPFDYCRLAIHNPILLRINLHTLYLYYLNYSEDCFNNRGQTQQRGMFSKFRIKLFKRKLNGRTATYDTEEEFNYITRFISNSKLRYTLLLFLHFRCGKVNKYAYKIQSLWWARGILEFNKKNITYPTLWSFEFVNVPISEILDAMISNQIL